VSRRLALRGALLACALTLAAAAPAAADIQKRIFSFNMCGAASHCPNQGDQHADAGIVQAIEDSVADFEPQIVALQEVCRGQFETLRQELSDGSGPQLSGRFATQNWDADNCNDDTKDFGVAIFSTAAILETYPAYNLAVGDADPPSDSEERKLLCIKVNWAKPTRTCSTHVTNAEGTNDNGVTYKHAQVKRIRDVVNPWVNDDHPVVVAGDFNAAPKWEALNPMYAPWLKPADSGNGLFVEVDQDEDELPDSPDPDPPCRRGEDTQGDLKIDFVFASDRHFDGTQGDATHSDVSDHDPLRGYVNLKTG
jgi:endonuclease/exonuclease/phosphatase family metal-dependent hydrolase